MTGRTRTSDTSREERMQEVLTALEQGIGTILTSEGYRQYLHTASRFHGYSFGNVVLVMLQRPDATRVAGFKTWKSLGRFVKKGEKGIRIMVPYKARIAQEDDDPLYVVRGFGVGYVWDITQTEGAPLPEPPAMQEPEGEHEETEHITMRLTRFARASGVTIVRDFTGTQRGYWHPTRREIGIRSDLTGISAVKTTCHEVAHFLADHRATVDRADAENVAESAAYVTLMHLGIDVSQYSFGYIAGWAKDIAVFRRNLGEVQKIGCVRKVLYFPPRGSTDSVASAAAIIIVVWSSHLMGTDEAEIVHLFAPIPRRSWPGLILLRCVGPPPVVA